MRTVWGLGKRSLAFTALGAVWLAAGCGRHDSQHDGAVRLGYVGGPLASSVYVAEERIAQGDGAPAFTGVPFHSSSDIGYALISGEIDAGFIEITRAVALFRSVSGLRAVGAVTFPYGATLVRRKDLDLRLDSLAGRTVAVAGRRCRLLHQFEADAERHGVDISAVTFVPMPFHQMIPALEARAVDAILTRGGHALLAAALDHPALYQNWDVKGDDECCPKTLAQVELVLVTRVRGVSAPRLEALISALQTADATPSDAIRAAVAARTNIPLASLAPFPVAFFTPLTDEQRAELGAAGDL